MTDGAAFDEWNPFIKHLSGDLHVGSKLDVQVQAGDGAPMTFAPEVLVADTAQELRWIGKLGIRGLFDGEHYFVLEEAADGATVLRHGERFSGMLTYALFALIGQDTQAGFEAMNVALKARAEART